MRVLILGGSGFIGSEIARRLADRGHRVTALARNTYTPSRRLPSVKWVAADIARLSKPDDWPALIVDADAIVNAAGALQSGPRDDVVAVQSTAMKALYAAAAQSSVRLVVQISARVEGEAATTAFLASKREADEALRRSGVPFVILRPAIVVGRNSYGGSALLRGLAGIPLVTPLAYPDTPMQFLAQDDLARIVADAVEERVAAGSELDLAAPETLSLARAVAIHRQWLGLPPAPVFSVPGWAARLAALGADFAGLLGWRSPLRSTAMQVAAGGVTVGAAGERGFKTLAEMLNASPAGSQDLWHARLYLTKPLLIAALSLFWLLSGSIALLRFDASSELLKAAGAATSVAATLTVMTAAADILLGVAVLFRRTCATALQAMIGLSLAYLGAASLLLPSLWADPLGPLVKVLPSIALALAALAMLEER
jgi:uncharacterized protein YbjT (DUF2867 family)/multisubunit Na+/H+ antiporter MnhG subunit